MESLDALPRPLSVADLDRKLRRALEGAGVDVWVEGEVTSFKAAASGHLYFTLRDEREDAAIECVMYRASAMRARSVLADGARVQVRGKATLWAPRGRLQFVVDAARAAGRGALLEALEQLKLKLAQEGLFAPERKRALPADPRLVGVVTSASGAAIHDIAQVAFRRGGARILLAPALVQGLEAPAQIVAALDRLEQVRGVDVIIVGRGGGASEDLAAFQDERVVRRVAACQVPVVSAVGHEVDITLTDLAADVRAATPSQAAELVVPEGLVRERVLRELRLRLSRAMEQHVLESRLVLGRIEGALEDPRQRVADAQQTLDDLEMRLREATRERVADERRVASRLGARLAGRHPRSEVAVRRGDLGELGAKLQAAVRRQVERRRSTGQVLAGRLQEMSPLTVLARGYAIAIGPGERAVRRASDVVPGEALRLRLHEGELHVRVEGSS